ncbi:MAG: hypothetical protein ACOX3T_01210 [Bdellovibrionota bacterium]
MEILKAKLLKLKIFSLKDRKNLTLHLQGEELLSSKHISEKTAHFLEDISQKLKISARSYVKILKVARTIADLENEPLILENAFSKCLRV